MKHFCSGLTSWKGIQSSCTTKEVLKKNFLLNGVVRGRILTGEEAQLQHRCRAALKVDLQKDTSPGSLLQHLPQLS